MWIIKSTFSGRVQQEGIFHCVCARSSSSVQCDRNYTYTLIFLFINNLMSSLGLQAAYTAGKLLHERAQPSAMFAAGKAAAAPHTAQSHLFYPTERSLFFAGSERCKSQCFYTLCRAAVAFVDRTRLALAVRADQEVILENAVCAERGSWKLVWGARLLMGLDYQCVWLCGKLRDA